MNKDILYSKEFLKHFKTRILPNKNLEDRFRERVTLFLQDRTNINLHDHQLQGKMRQFRSFSVKGDCRVIYKETQKDLIFLFVDIGTHNQVYKK